MHKLDPTHKKILAICKAIPSTINDRPLLLDKFYGSDWNYNQTLYFNFTNLTRVETIMRRFRELRKWGYIKESEAVEDKNLDAMRNERDRASPVPPISDLWAKRYEKAVQTRRNSEQTSLL